MIKNNVGNKNLLKNGINYIIGGLFILYFSITTAAEPIFLSLINVFMIFIGANILVDGLVFLMQYIKFYKHTN